MTACRYTKADTVDKALDALREAGGDAHIIAGGVALGVLMNERLLEPEWLIDISRLKDLKQIVQAEDGGVRIGALMTHSEVERSQTVRDTAPLMTEMCREIACGRIKNRGTIGGNICLADPQGDPPVALLALDATGSIIGPEGQRTVPIRAFFVDLYETALADGEFLSDVQVPPTPQNAGYAYEKFGARKAMDYTSTISAAVQVVLDPNSGTISSIGTGLGGVGITPVWPSVTEKLFLDVKPSAISFQQVRESLFEELEPVEDHLYSADYKRHVACVMLERAVIKACAMAQSMGATTP